LLGCPQVTNRTELEIQPQLCINFWCCILHLSTSHHLLFAALHLASCLNLVGQTGSICSPQSQKLFFPLNYIECIVFKWFYHYYFKLTSSRVTIKIKPLGLSLPFTVTETVLTVSCSLSPDIPFVYCSSLHIGKRVHSFGFQALFTNVLTFSF
jgi:hypothetical protein